MMNEPISSIMTRSVVTVHQDDPLSLVKNILFEKHLHHLPVVDGRKLIGIITSFDLVKLGKRFDEYENIKVKEVMTRNVATLGPNNKIGAAAEVFLSNLFHGLPIVDEEKNLVGIITTHDILKYEFHKEYPRHKELWATV
ncbi:MAG: hypothetical protein DHS20C18_04260 [Saprospiraceae bacterium]|nr:MAG: hypothetical protein DHS20C18_04260 [Saprospiraceae bacterium]